jgi:hypothetical protein
MVVSQQPIRVQDEDFGIYLPECHRIFDEKFRQIKNGHPGTFLKFG